MNCSFFWPDSHIVDFYSRLRRQFGTAALLAGSPGAYFAGMLKYFELEPDLYVAGQIDETDLDEINRLGIRSIIGNRPDEEVGEEHVSDRIAEAAGQYGIEFSYQPLWGFELGEPEHIDRFGKAVSKMPGPILLYCRTGRRSTILWALAAVKRLGLDTVRSIAGSAGFDADEIEMLLEDQLEQMAA